MTGTFDASPVVRELLELLLWGREPLVEPDKAVAVALEDIASRALPFESDDARALRLLARAFRGGKSLGMKANLQRTRPGRPLLSKADVERLERAAEIVAERLMRGEKQEAVVAEVSSLAGLSRSRLLSYLSHKRKAAQWWEASRPLRAAAECVRAFEAHGCDFHSSLEFVSRETGIGLVDLVVWV
ncbi:MAG: hypothetical protein SNJ79_09985 [Sphingomonadaceae bacterium]